MTFLKRVLVGVVFGLTIAVNTGCTEGDEEDFASKFQLTVTTKNANTGMVETLIKACGGTNIIQQLTTNNMTIFRASLPDQTTVGKGFAEEELSKYGPCTLLVIKKKKCLKTGPAHKAPMVTLAEKRYTKVREKGYMKDHPKMETPLFGSKPPFGGLPYKPQNK